MCKMGKTVLQNNFFIYRYMILIFLHNHVCINKKYNNSHLYLGYLYFKQRISEFKIPKYF